MARKKRHPFTPGKTYHVWNRGNRKDRVFYDNKDRSFFWEKILTYASDSEITVIAICLMDNHYHLILIQGNQATISKLIQRGTTSYSLWFNKKYKTVGHSFQGRFKSRLVRNNKDLKSLVDYVHNNPIEAGYVKDNEHYKWLYINPKYLS